MGAREGCTQRAATAGGRAPRRSELHAAKDYSGLSHFSGRRTRRRESRSCFAVRRRRHSHQYGRLRARPTARRSRRAPARRGHRAAAFRSRSLRPRVRARRACSRGGSRGGSARSLADARHVLAVTFTRRAAGELVDRIDALGVDAAVTAGTFHALALAQLRRRATENRRELPRILDRKARVLGPLLRASGPQGTLAIADVATEIEWAKARMIPPERYAAAARAAERRLPRSPAELADLYARYEAEKRKRRWLDFDDLLGWCADAIEHDDDFAAAQRWRFRHLFVDEFQDATPLQLRLLRAWLGDRPDLCVVGDGAQAIYAFAGADASPLVDFARHFPGGRTVALAYNYRSTDAIVAVAEAALGPASGVERDAPARGAPGRPARRDPRLRRRRRGSRRGRRRVLARVHRRRAVASHGRAVPHQRAVVVVRSRAHPPGRAVPRHRRAAVRGAAGGARAARPTARGRPERAPGDRSRSISATSRPTSTKNRRRSDDRRRRRPTPAASQPRRASDDELRTHRDALLRFGREYLAGEHGPGSVAGFVSWLDLATRGESSDERGVDLVTFHRAKGLEWQVVFVTGLERGLVPISWATHAIGPRRGATVAARRARARRRLGALLVGTRAHRVRPAGRRASRPRGSPSSNARRGARASSRSIPRQRLGQALATLQHTTPPAPTSHARRIKR